MTAFTARRARSLSDAAWTTRARQSKRGDRTHLTTARYVVWSRYAAGDWGAGME